jgi:hypothetical protein
MLRTTASSVEGQDLLKGAEGTKTRTPAHHTGSVSPLVDTCSLIVYDKMVKLIVYGSRVLQPLRTKLTAMGSTNNKSDKTVLCKTCLSMNHHRLRAAWGLHEIILRADPSSLTA